MKKLIRRILNEQITQGNCANKTYLHPSPGDEFAVVRQIATTYGNNASFGNYYSETNTTTPGCCESLNGNCLGVNIRIVPSTTFNPNGTIYTQHGINAYTWQQFIDQVNAVHIAALQTNAYTVTTSMGWNTAYSSGGDSEQSLHSGGISNRYFQVEGEICTGCSGPILIPGCMDSLATNYDPNAQIDDNSCVYRYDCVDNRCIKAANGPYNSNVDCIKSGCGHVIDDTRTTASADPDCTQSPKVGCWACHIEPGASQPPQSCWQPPLTWINGVGKPQGFNFYNTEADCMNAGEECISPQTTTGGEVSVRDEENIKEDIKRMKGLIKY